MDKDKKPFHKGNRKPFRKDRKGASGGRFKRKLEPGVEFEDRRLCFGIGCREMTLEEIGDKFNLTRERVRQIKEKAIRKLKGGKSALLKSYL